MKTAESLTTGIGSLPHHNVDSALEFSFRMDIPFLPQIPIRNPWEYMVAQALEGLPGLQVQADGSTSLSVPIWESRARAFGEKLDRAFQSAGTDPAAFEAFEPSNATSSGWQPFLFELEERGSKRAKVQIAGPMTSQWAIQLKDSGARSAEQIPGLSTQIYRLVLARALAMTRRLQAQGIREPIIYLDEPGLYGFTVTNAKHVMGLQELKIMLQTLRKEGVTVGLHCCSNTDWNTILDLGAHGLGILSLDTALSLKSLVAEGRAQKLDSFVAGGGRLSFGVVPTARSSVLHSLKGELLLNELLETLREAWPGQEASIQKIVSSAIFTPACGLAFHSVADAELVLEVLGDVVDGVRAR